MPRSRDNARPDGASRLVSPVTDEHPNPASAEAILSELASVFLNDAAFSPAAVDSASDGQKSVKPDEALPHHDNMYRVLVEQVPAVVFIAYLERGISEVYVSPQIESALGFSQAEWLEDPIRWYGQIHPEDKQRWSSDAAAMCLTGSPLKSAYRVMARDGRVVWFQCEVKMVRRPDGRPWFLHGIGFDISELKQTEEALRQRTIALRDLSARLIRLQDDEHRRLSRELHDSLGQYLVAIKMNLLALRNRRLARAFHRRDTHAVPSPASARPRRTWSRGGREMVRRGLRETQWHRCLDRVAAQDGSSARRRRTHSLPRLAGIAHQHPPSFRKFKRGNPFRYRRRRGFSPNQGSRPWNASRPAQPLPKNGRRSRHRPVRNTRASQRARRPPRNNFRHEWHRSQRNSPSQRQAALNPELPRTAGVPPAYCGNGFRAVARNARRQGPPGSDGTFRGRFWRRILHLDLAIQNPAGSRCHSEGHLARMS